MLHKRARANGILLFPATSAKTAIQGLQWTSWRDNGVSEIVQDAYFNPLPEYMGVICGEVEAIDVDSKNDESGLLAEKFDAALRSNLPAEVYQSIFIEKTPSGGRHYIYKTSSPRASTVLARCKFSPERASFEGCDNKPVIETRGKGGICIVAPSKNYESIQGEIAVLPLISDEDRDLIWMLAIEFNTYVRPASIEVQAASMNKDGVRPGDKYNTDVSVAEIVSLLASHGYRAIRNSAQSVFFSRPGAKHPNKCDATISKDLRVFYAFSTSVTDVEPNRGYSFFGLFAALEHRGDYRAAAAALSSQGYGSQGAVVSSGSGAVDARQHNDALPEKDVWAEILLDSFDITKKPANNHNLFIVQRKSHYNVEEIGIAFKGAMIMVSGREKSRKTTFLGALVADGIRRQSGIKIEGTDTLPFKWVDMGKVLWVDTEQPKYWFYQTQARIMVQAGVASHDHYLAVSMKKDLPNERIAKIDLIIERFSPGTIIIDGITDLIWDTNDLKESNMLWEKHLNRWLTMGLTIFGVIHENKDASQRGHIGKMLQRKMDAGFSVKSLDDVNIEVAPSFSRGMRFNPFNLSAGKDGILFSNKMPNYDFGIKDGGTNSGPVAEPEIQPDVVDWADIPF